MTIIEHLLELRNRLFKASLAIVAGMIVGFLVSQFVYELLERPYNNLPDPGEDWIPLQQLQPMDGFILRLKISLWVGLIIAAPFWLYQLWAFIAPGLHRRERRWAYIFGAISVPLFVSGALLAYFVVERGLRFLLEAGLEGVAIQLEVTGYIDFITMVILVFGLSFQFPVLILLLNFSGLVSARKLLGAWRVVVFACFAFAAVFTPDPGPFGMILLAACLCLLYFAAIGVAFLNDRRKAKHDPYADLADDELSPLDDDLEPVTAGEPVEPAAAITEATEMSPTPLDSRYDDMT